MRRIIPYSSPKQSCEVSLGRPCIKKFIVENIDARSQITINNSVFCFSYGGQ